VTAPRFLTEPEPARGVALPVAPGIFRIVAKNPGPMTYHGTNTYLIADASGFAVLDPGPDDARHVSDILAASGGRVSRVLLSHGHVDHVGALPALVAATGAPVFSATDRFGPPVRDGESVEGWVALATPGHAPDHLCFARDGVVFSADHVMSFSTSVVIPPDGDMAAYMSGLRRMLLRTDRLLLPGHGPPMTEPAPFVEALLEHRLGRENSIRALLGERPRTAGEIVAALYVPLDPRLVRAAEANVLAHLLKLRAEGVAIESAGVWRT
jgi:glyoxylase-like metal-dependent hydrolase (beta-lactamase superfamily II)